jgi:ABC-type bacteriocin/lantibiotic exporter with double-glycine peptidase domain
MSDFLASPEIQSFLENNILKPLLDKVFSYLYPYLLGIMSLWIIMFLCTIMILLLLLKTGFPV